MDHVTTDPRGAFDSELSIRADGATTWTLLAPLIWNGTQGDTFTVPVGFRTDFATVPRFLRWLINPYGAYTRAAVLHDWLLAELAAWHRTHPLGGRETWDTTRPAADSRDTDGIFRRVMEDLDVPWATRWLMWAGVRWASIFNHNRSYGRRIAADLPRMIGISIPALIVTPAALAVLVTLGLLRIISLPSRRRRA